MPRYRAQTLELELDDDSLVKETVVLEQATGNLTVISNPSGAEVYLDGSRQSDTTPIQLKNLTAGDHQLEVIFQNLASPDA